MYNKASIQTNSLRILLYFVVFSIPILLAVNFIISVISDLQIEVITEKAVSRQKEIADTTEFQINSLLNNIYDDLNLIRYSNEFSDFLENPGLESFSEAEQMFSRFLTSKDQYFQLRYLNQNGMEILRVENNNDGIVAIEGEDLQDKSGRYYYKSLIKMGSYDFYISDFDLNVEHNEYVKPYQPAIRFAIPVLIDHEKSGYLMINFDGQKFIDILEKYEIGKYQSINISIMDKNHLLTLNLLTTHQSLVESLLETFSDKDSDFVQLYTQVTTNDHGIFRDGSKNIYFQRINGTDNPKWMFDTISGNWIIVSDFDLENIINENGNFLTDNINPIRLILSVIIGLITLVIVFLNILKEDDELLLLASTYISETTHEGVLITDRRRRIIYCNKVFETTYGYDLSEIKGKEPDKFLKGETKIKLGKLESDDYVWNGNIWDVTSDGTYILKYLKIKAIKNVHKKIVYYIGIYSEPKINFLGEEVENIVSHHLLGASMDFIIPVVEKKFNELNKKAVIAIRFSDFDMIRSQITDKEDNAIVSTISNSFKYVLAAGGIVMVPATGILLIVAPIKVKESLHNLMEKIDASLTAIKFSLSSNIRLNYISGVAVSPEHGIRGHELINNAFIALEALSRMKRSKYLVYDQDIYDLVKKDKIIKDEIENAFRNNEFSVVYQLQQDIKTLANTGVEALVRWNSPKIGSISPNSFIPIMEESGQISRLGKYILARITTDFNDLYVRLPENFHISINLSSQEFNNSEIVSDLIKIIQASNIPTKYFCFEITETSIVNTIEYTNEIIAELHEYDISTAIDDFGTGYSSLGYLKNIDADKIKIDRIFIKDYPDADDGRILRSIIKMVKEIPKEIIIEGIETEEQLEFTRQYNCEEFQGYLSSKPLSFEEILKKLL